MKNLELKNTSYHYLEQSFKEWLTIIGYSDNTINTWPVHVREFLYYLEQHNVQQIQQVTSQRTYNFLHHIKHRKSNRTGTALSTHSINKIINSINAFAKYINITGKHTLDITPKHLELNTIERSILTKEEIKDLYEASFMGGGHNTSAMGQRDRAIIAVFYGCGLRKNEGTQVNITDINTQTGTVFVRKAKGNKQRHVPIATKHLEDIKDYLEYGRNWFLKDNRSPTHVKKYIKKQHTDDEAFFLNNEGKRMQSFYYRLSILKERAGIDKEFSTHTLRHSVATHLLQSGMKIEDIAKFLGHASLESTQLYTHIVNTLDHDKNRIL
jgi:integrase/recombinase XerD